MPWGQDIRHWDSAALWEAGDDFTQGLLPPG